MLFGRRYRESVFLFFGVFVICFYLNSYISDCCRHRVSELESMFIKSRNCFVSKNMSQRQLKDVWPNLPLIAEECSGELYNNMTVQIFEGGDEIKYFIGPISNYTFTCDIMTLGIGGDTAAEENIFRLYPQCKFIGIDSGAKDSEMLYTTRINGKYIEGLVGAKNGTYKANVLESDVEHGYVEKVLPHFSFHHVTSKIFKKDLIDLLLMDIEGDEFLLMKELIENANKYPTICQLNVEFHDPFNQKQNVMEIFDIATIKGPYLLLKTRYMFGFNRAFFINFKSSLCANKFFSIKF